MVLQPGDTAPTITATNQDGAQVTVDTDGPAVVYFYPRDDTPGCTVEAKQFEAERTSYEEAGVAVYGVSTDDVESHAAFCDKFGLGFDLLADPDGAIAEAFDVPLRNNAAPRTTFVLLDGEVYETATDVDPDGHARELLMMLLDDGVVSLPE